jgi:hypothetical protein
MNFICPPLKPVLSCHELLIELYRIQWLPCSHREGLFVCDDSIMADREDIGDQKWILLGIRWIFTALSLLL